MFPKCSFQNVARQQLCPELISKPWKIILFHINTEENVISTEIKGEKLSRSVCQEWWKTEKSLQQESWESQHGETMSFPAHQHIHVICVVKIYSPLAPAATLNAVCRQEVGQKPIFVPVLLWLHHGPCTSEKKGRSGGSPGSVLGWAGCQDRPSSPCAPWQEREWSLQPQELPLGVLTSLCLLEKDFKGIRDLVCG